MKASTLGEAQAAPLLGRKAEQQLLTSMMNDVSEHGAALVLHGEPGIGKSRLMFEAERMARERGMTVLSALGVQTEAQLAYAGLHQLLRPIRKRVSDLRDVERAALEAAFGWTDEGAPEQFRIAMAVLDLLCDVATDAPVLVVVEDGQWLDRPSSEVLAFVARRIESDPIVVLVAVRNGYPSALNDAGLPDHLVLGLDDESAAALLDTVAPRIPAVTRTLVLREAAGNPLAILELPAAVGRHGDDRWPGGDLPLTSRLERAFASRVSDLPDATRLLLLVAALSDEERIDEILEASTALAGTPVELDVAAPASAAGIVDVDLQKVRFRHPLVRSAIARSASLAERLRAHQALADVLADQPDRRAWHRAALASGECEDIAHELDEAAARARRRGAGSAAITAATRAAELGAPESRSRRLVAAAELALEIGRRDLVGPLLREVNPKNLGELDRARSTFVEEAALTRPLEASRFMSLIAAAERAGAAGDYDLHVNLLWLIASRSWWADPKPDSKRAIVAAANRLGDANTEDPRAFAVHAYADPLGHAPAVLARLEREARGNQLDPDAARFFGPAALVVGAFDVGAVLLGAAVDGLRKQGRLGHLPRLLMLYASAAARIGECDAALTAADEARRLAEEFHDRQAAAAADTAFALVAGMQGDEQMAELLAARAEVVAEPVGARITMAFAQFGKVLARLAAGRHSDAYASAVRLFDPDDSAYHPVVSAWLIADLAEASIHIDKLKAARGLVAQVDASVGESPGTWIVLGLRHARALLSDPAEAGERFEEALAGDVMRSPFQRARIQLSYGQWLRRHRSVAASRDMLRASRDTFDALGCAQWSDCARRELRASGERSRRRVPGAREHLTAQELQIAQLAADGLSNREIGQRLYLSHRTISTHLYRVFPKLGITSRAELHAALAPAAMAGAG